MLTLKKTLLPALMVAAINLSAQTSSIIGLEGIYNNTDAQEPTLRTNYSQSSAGFGLRIGAENEEFRFLLIYEIIQDEKYNNIATVSQNMITGNLDYFIPTQSQTIKPFIGVIFGQAEYKFSSYSDSSYIYGAEVGLDFNINKHYSIDIFGRYIPSSLDTVNHYIQSGIGLNYKF